MIRRLVLALVLVATPASAAPWIVEGPALVREDGSLDVAGRHVRLFGIWLPQGERVCTTLLRPTFCAPRSVVVLYEKVQRFLSCQVVRPMSDGSLEAFCGQPGRRLFDPREDLAAAMIEEGWALARPDAPPEYRALERLAESRELGLWGTRITNVR